MWTNGERPPYRKWSDKPKDIIDEDAIDICLSINMLRRLLGSLAPEWTSDEIEGAIDCFMAGHHDLMSKIEERSS